MIPIRLTMRNFMCYRGEVPPLSFNGIHTACICGDNGNGKSALIDAITWALWGKARAKGDDDLVHLGETEMEVEFDFAVGKQPYRIIRKHAKPRRRGGSGQTVLEFQIATEDGFRSISGNSVTQTQQKVIDSLHMDYTTFVNSAFLRQGHADEFTIKRPSERKEVLAGILELAFYDRLEEKAKDLAKEQEMARAQLETALQDIDAGLNRKLTYEAELEQAQAELTRIEAAAAEQETRLNSRRREKESLEGKKLHRERLEENIARAERDLARWDDQAQQHLMKTGEYEELLDQCAAIEEDYARFAGARELNDELNRKLGLLVKLNNRKSELERAIDGAQAALVREHALAQSRLKELEDRAQRLPQLKSQLQQVTAELHRLAEPEETLDEKKQAARELRTRVSYLESSKTQLEREIREAEEKLDLLSARTEARCPLCETELGTDGVELIRAKYTADRDSKSDNLKSSQVELIKQSTELKSLEGEIAELEGKLGQDRASLQSQAGIIKKEIAEVEAADTRLTEGREELAGIEQRLAGKDYTAAEQSALREVDGQLAALGYDAQQHEQARHSLAELEPGEARKRKLEEAERLIGSEKEAAARAEQAARELRGSLETDRQKREELAAELELLPWLADDLTRAEADYRALVAQQKQAQEGVWGIKASLQRCDELAASKKEKEKLLSQTAKQENIYKDLVQAFGKKGVQALLIEMALPEIETETNKLLGRMTDNRMQVKMETQRASKKGDLLETLDINISDELGTRNYEMFSGGEAFRINFAVRIALSKMLARRAGAPLPTLIIDEGFGTQDSTGIEKLKEGITSIQDDFEKVIVITHIEELKDAFPARINVVKTPQGATVELG